MPVPVISSFTATPSSIQPGQFSQLAWLVTDASSLRLEILTEGKDTGGLEVLGSTSHVVWPGVTSIYTLSALNGFGPTVSTVTVTVADEERRLRRSVFGAPTVGVGVDHPAGSRFAFLNPNGVGTLKIPMDPLWIGKELFFKFQPFNTFGGGSPPLADLTAYPYTVIGVALNQNPNVVNYTQTPGVALSLVTGRSFFISMLAVDEQFPSNTVHYNARTVIIPDFNQRYFLTIKDPGFLGDVGTDNTTLLLEANTTQTLAGKAGYTYVGSVGPSPQGPVITPGGWPPPGTYLVNGT